MTNRKQKSAFTLVELLVVIGIIALLIAILLPALSKARKQARRTQDLSNIRQVAIACVAYATENKGDWPLGSREGPNTTNPPTTNDDLAWINSYTFGTLLQFLADRRSAALWMGNPTSTPVVAGKPLDPSQQRRLACTSMYDSPDGGVLLSNVGTTAYQYYSLQTSPSGACYCETYMGFIYWGRRADCIAGAIYDNNGAVTNPVQTYSFPTHQGTRPSSQTLLTCPAYSSSGYSCYWPHSGPGDSFRQHASVTAVGNGITDVSSVMQGICVAYTDGSARWVPRKQLWSVYEGSTASNPTGGYDWVFFDKTNP